MLVGLFYEVSGFVFGCIRLLGAGYMWKDDDQVGVKIT